jgi:hypothetical protein
MDAANQKLRRLKRPRGMGFSLYWLVYDENYIHHQYPHASKTLEELIGHRRMRNELKAGYGRR